MRSVWLVTAFLIMLLMIMPAIALASLTNLGALSSTTSSYLDNKNVFIYTGPLIKGDYYAFGNCTYWVYYLRKEINQPIPTTWGNAISWAVNAQKGNYLVNNIPSFGAIMQDPNAYGGLGHVAFVTNVNPGVNFTISEMNRVGFDEVDSRTISFTQLSKYNFIHDQIN